MASADDQTRLPGEPFPDGELDPELIALPRKRPQVGPLLALSVIVLSVFLVVRLWPDLIFLLQAEPERAPDPAALLAHGTDNAYVEVRALPDLSAGVLVRKSRGSYGHRLRPVLGTQSALWVLEPASHWSANPAHDLVYRGRLTRLGDLPFYDQARAAWATLPSAERVVTPEALRTALVDAPGSGAREVAVVGGDRVSLAPDRTLEVSQSVPGKVQVTTYVTDDLSDEPAWTLALQHAGLVIDGGRSQGQGKSGETFLYRVLAPGGVEAVEELLSRSRLYAARAEPVMRSLTTTLGQVQASAAGLTIDDELISWSSIAVARLVAGYDLSPDARVLVAGDNPGDYWYVLPLLVVLALAALLFAVVLLRPLWSAARRRET